MSAGIPLASEVATYLQVLQDAGRRRQYDAARSASPSGSYAGYSPGYGSSSGGGFQPGVDNDDFEEAFRKWWEKSGGKCVESAAYPIFLHPGHIVCCPCTPCGDAGVEA